MKEQSKKAQSSKPKNQTSQAKSVSPSKPTGSIGGHEYVDLGLPSGLMWATCNVGASKPEEFGSYFAWGETRPKSSYIEDDSKTYDKDYIWLKNNAYIDLNFCLTIDHDAAHANWGLPWRMPTKDDIDELLDNTTTIWTKIDGVNGRLVISKRNGNSIFIPASGYYYGRRLFDSGDQGNYWSSTPSGIDTVFAFKLSISSENFEWDWKNRSCGLPVRPVADKNFSNRNEYTANQNLKNNVKSTPAAKPTTGTTNGHRWVDLGLPSGLKWATYIGSYRPEGYSSFFAWGEIKTKSRYDDNLSETYRVSNSLLKSNGYINYGEI